MIDFTIKNNEKKVIKKVIKMLFYIFTFALSFIFITEGFSQ